MSDLTKSVRSIEDARKMTPSSFDLNINKMSIEEMIHIFNIFDAFWEYDGEPDPTKPHAILKGKEHSNGFVNCGIVLCESNLCEIFAMRMVQCLYSLAEWAEVDRHVDWVVGSAYSACDLSHDVARILRARHGIAEKDKDGTPTIFRHKIAEGERVLMVNELMTTAQGSTWEMKKAVIDGNPDVEIDFFPYTMVLVHRSPEDRLFDGSPVQAVFHFDMDKFQPEDCPYCKAGSEAIKPKVPKENWDRLHG